jgi:[ribosomal protein S5]-alanine N-acetyltransferase
VESGDVRIWASAGKKSRDDGYPDEEERPDGMVDYDIRVKGVLDARWSALFTPLALVALPEETLITGPVQDQSELFGVLLKIRDMGLQLVSVNPTPRPRLDAPFPELTTGRLRLRAFNLGDAPAVFEILRREDVNQWLETDPLRSIEEAEARIRARMGLFTDGMGYRWAITLRHAPAVVIGSCGFFHVRRGTQTFETGFELNPDYWRQGIMTEAMQAMIQFSLGAQNPLPVHRIEALVAPENAASIRLLEKLGFDREGLRREFFLWKRRYHDVILYAFLRPIPSPPEG